MTDARQSQPSMPERILDIAERLVQTRGFNGFSYADVAGRLGVTKASLHYHYSGKAQLGEALILRYTTRFSEALAGIERDHPDAAARLAAYTRLYSEVLAGDRMCLCGMLAAEYETLAQPMQDAVVTFFDVNEAWLAGVLEQGRAVGTIELNGSTRDAARVIVSGLEGAMLVTRPYRDPQRFQAAAESILAAVVHAGASAARVAG